MNVPLLILGLVLVIGLVITHEIGHFIVAKRNGVTPLEFGLFFPPRIVAWKIKGGWDLSLNLLPLGGFVRLKGEHDTDTQPGSFGAASLWVKTKIMLAGIAVNLVTAFVMFSLIALIGFPVLVDHQFSVSSDATQVHQAQKYVAVGAIVEGSPAAKAGIKPNDQLVSLQAAGRTISVASADELHNLTKQYAGQTVTLAYRPGGPSGKLTTKQITLLSSAAIQAAAKAGKAVGPLGVEPADAQNGVSVVRYTWSAPIVAAGSIAQFTWLTLQGLGQALHGLGGIIAGLVTHNTSARLNAQEQATSQVAGPVGIFYVFKYGSTLGLTFMLFLVAFISMTLAIMNLLPVPALDGGRLWLILITRALKLPLSARSEEAINAVGFAFLMVLVVLITVVDVHRFH